MMDAIVQIRDHAAPRVALMQTEYRESQVSRQMDPRESNMEGDGISGAREHVGNLILLKAASSQVQGCLLKNQMPGPE